MRMAYDGTFCPERVHRTELQMSIIILISLIYIIIIRVYGMIIYGITNYMPECNYSKS